MRVRALFVTLLLLAAVRTGAHAQDVHAFMNRVAAAWGREDAEAISELADREGISLEVEGTRVGSIPPRHAAAVLRRLFNDSETVRARAGAAKMTPGSQGRAYAEIVWERRSRGTTQAERSNVFIAVARDRAGWHITEIRLIQ